MGLYMWDMVNSLCVCGGGGVLTKRAAREVFRLFIFHTVSPILQQTLVKLLISFISRLKYKKYLIGNTFVEKQEPSLAYKSVQFLHTHLS